MQISLSIEVWNCPLVFSVASLLCRGAWLIELVEKLGLRPHSALGTAAGVRHSMTCYRTVDVAVAPVGTR